MRNFSLYKTFAPMYRGFLLLIFVALGGCMEPAIQNPSVASAIEANQTNVFVDRPRLANYFDSLYESGRFNGTLFMASNDSITCLALGKPRLKGKDSLEPNDVFQLASLSKPITALGVLRLVEKGMIELDAPISTYLFDFPDPQITIRSLLNHTSGMGNYIYVTDSLWNNPDSFMSNDDVYDLVRCEQVPTYHPPLKRFDYCNTNYAVLPVLIERVSGLTFPLFMQQEIFAPLRMHRTHYLDPWQKAPDAYRVLGHYPNGDPKRPFYLDGVVGDKSLYSSVEDLFKLYKAMQESDLWSKELLQEAMQPSARSGNGQFYGLGWRIRPIEGDTMVFHNGWWRGFRSYFWMSKKENKVAIILTNSIRGGYLSQSEIWPLF
ncbi:MAG: serine hydrolase domain-containing protein [Cryomorphaceae bacterium]